MEMINNAGQKKAPAISIVMPCYNVENYVADALDTVLEQTFQDYEVICLDDGSKDRTLDILKAYAKKDKRIRVIANENHGAGYERSEGVRHAGGEYIYYMDSDDLLEPECLQVMYEQAKADDLDLLFIEGRSFYDPPEIQKDYPQYENAYIRKGQYPDIYPGYELFIKLRQEKDYSVVPWIQLTKRSLIVDNQIWYPDIPRSEDILYSIRILLRAERVKCIAKVLYNRRVRPGSIVTAVKRHAEIKAVSYTIRELSLENMQYGRETPLHRELDKYIFGLYKRLAAAIEQERLENEMQGKVFDWYEDISREQLAYALASVYIEDMKKETKRLEKELRLLKKQL